MDWLQVVLGWVNWAIGSGPNLLAAVMSVLAALIALCLLIPGEQPERALQSALDWLSKLSKK